MVYAIVVSNAILVGLALWLAVKSIRPVLIPENGRWRKLGRSLRDKVRLGSHAA